MHRKPAQFRIPACNVKTATNPQAITAYTAVCACVAHASRGKKRRRQHLHKRAIWKGNYRSKRSPSFSSFVLWSTDQRAAFGYDFTAQLSQTIIIGTRHARKYQTQFSACYVIYITSSRVCIFVTHTTPQTADTNIKQYHCLPVATAVRST